MIFSQPKIMSDEDMEDGAIESEDNEGLNPGEEGFLKGYEAADEIEKKAEEEDEEEE